MIALAALLLSGCAVVKPHEREQLASPAMTSPWDDGQSSAELESKVVQAKTGGALPGDAPGGGCGCTQ